MSLFPTRLKTLRKEAGKTQQELAESINISKQTISNYESGFREPSIDILREISSHFNVSVDYIIGVSEMKNHGLASVNNQLEELNAVMSQYSGVDYIKQNVINGLSVLLDLILRHTPDPLRMLDNYIEILKIINQHDLFLAETHSSASIKYFEGLQLEPHSEEEATRSINEVRRALEPNLEISKKELDTTRKFAEFLLGANQAYILERVEHSVSPRLKLEAQEED